MPGGIAPMELIIIAVIALVVLGPKRLPDAARSVGKGMREMRDAFSDSSKDDDDDFDARRFERVEDDDLDGKQEPEAAASEPADEKAEATASVPAEKA